MAEKLLTAEEAAKAMGVIVQTIYQWTLAGMPKIKRGRRNYFRLSDIKAFRGIIDEAEDPKLPESPPSAAPTTPPPGGDSPLSAPPTDGLAEMHGQGLKDALTRERARKERIAAQALQVKLDREMGRLLPVNDVEEILSAFMGRTKAALVNLPITMGHRMSLCADAAEAERELERWAAETLRDLKELIAGVIEGKD